jgi:hypothetical protein
MIDEVLFSEFVGSRQDLKKPMTERAKKMMVNKLLRLEAQGYCPTLLMERSIINGWQDVYPSEECKKVQLRQVGFIEKHTDRSWAEGLETKRLK